MARRAPRKFLVIGKPKFTRGSTRMNADQEWGWNPEVYAQSGMTWDAVGYQGRGMEL